jgi:hypothetical protein
MPRWASRPALRAPHQRESTCQKRRGRRNKIVESVAVATVIRPPERSHSQTSTALRRALPAGRSAGPFPANHGRPATSKVPSPRRHPPVSECRGSGIWTSIDFPCRTTNPRSIGPNLAFRSVDSLARSNRNPRAIAVCYPFFGLDPLLYNGTNGYFVMRNLHASVGRARIKVNATFRRRMRP